MVFKKWLYGHCCEYQHNNYNAPENGGPGCCEDAYGDEPSTCCVNPTDTWDPVTRQCIPQCPCEGCCDFNCCDELDYFMHKAFEEYYSQDYD